MKINTFFPLFFVAFLSAALGQQDWRTDYEKSGFTRSPRFAEMMQYIHRLEKASPWIKVVRIGSTPQGRELPLVLLSKQKTFTPAQVLKKKLPVVLIQCGIHSGEIDGKDASLMLMREIAITKSLERLAESVVILVLPIFNLDGHERQSKYNRINQDGPEEMGWRTTAQNYNLNRDYMKADAPEMRAWLRVYNEWKPDLLIDCHVTDGIDFQYNLTYSMEMFENAPAAIVKWQKELEQEMIKGMDAADDPICPYVFPREENDLSKGLIAYAAPPRFSTGYAAIRNRAALLIETHMLKPYKARVTATYRLLIEVLKFVNANPHALHNAVETADTETINDFSARARSEWYPIRFRRTENADTVSFLGYEMEMRRSDISGNSYPVWHHDQPMKVRIPFFDEVIPSLRVRPPLIYFIPQEWTTVIAVLKAHDVQLAQLMEPASVAVETYLFTNPKWRNTPYENHHTLESVSHTTRMDTILYPAGTFVVKLDQHAAKAAVHLLEPDGPDSFLYWGFFDPIFEQKEYFESYVMEDIAPRMLHEDPALKTEFEHTLAADTTLAKNPRARLNFFYERSPYSDNRLNVYPVGRCFEAVKLKTRL